MLERSTEQPSTDKDIAYQKTLMAGWGDMDFNAHMRNTAYLDKAADVRMMYFAEHGYATEKFAQIGFGPIAMKDEVEYFKEIGLLDSITVTFLLKGISNDSSRFTLRNEFYRADGVLAARVTTLGGWMDLQKRKLRTPPEALSLLLGRLKKTDDFGPL